jgi:hypothetical protein
MVDFEHEMGDGDVIYEAEELGQVLQCFARLLCACSLSTVPKKMKEEWLGR